MQIGVIFVAIDSHNIDVISTVGVGVQNFFQLGYKLPTCAVDQCLIN